MLPFIWLRPLFSLLALFIFDQSKLVSAWEREPIGQNLIVLLIDGYGANLFNRTNAKIQHGAEILLQNGVQAEYMKPVFQHRLAFLTFNSLATGLYVENHNFSSDFMYNEEADMLYQRDQGANDTDPSWWNLNTAPLWYTVGKAHIDVHCYWFATCHRAFVDMVVTVPKDRRHSFKNENEAIDLFPHLPKIMKHIKKYQAYRQQLVLLRYDGLARALKMFGEETDPTIQALSNADVHIRKIQEEIDNHDLFDSTNFVVLSDHGLMKIVEEDQFYIEECLADFSRIKKVVNSLAFTFIYPAEGEEDTVYFELKVCDQWAPVGDYDEEKEVPLVSVYRKSEIPDKYHWKNSRHVGPILLVTRPGVILLTRQLPSTDVSEGFGRDLKMIGGWDNDNNEMHSIFLARGPAFKVNHKTGPIEIVDVYQLLLSILGVKSQPNNGTWTNVEEMLADDWEDRTDSGCAFQTHINFLVSSFIVACLLVLQDRMHM
uniref:Ectonucleotide pyrophosphatase/phosphodiesterase family member 6 n=1 Tax=Ditylenchus dipsaci TaxID=166011 RepID=A0A915D393_9BILA